MTFRGEYRDGVIVPDEPLGYPSGTRLQFGTPKRARADAGNRPSAPTGDRRAARGTGRAADSGAPSRGGRKPARSKARSSKGRGSKGHSPTILDILRPFIGKIKGLPRDFAVNHDHYLYGVPKREP